MAVNDAPVRKTDDGAWEIRSHPGVRAAANDPQRFSSRYSTHLHLPNGLDGDEHRAYRELVDRYLTGERVAALEPQLRTIARELVAELTTASSGAAQAVRLDAVADLGARFAVRAQARWLGWPESLEPTLLEWLDANHAAVRSGSRERTGEVARRFDQIVHSVIAPRRVAGDEAPFDVTTELIRDRALGRPLTDHELVSILRNWTGGDLGSLAFCVGVISYFLATRPEIAGRIGSGASSEESAAIIDEILRLDDPFVSSRRVAACPVEVAGTPIAEGERVRLNWRAANVDPGAFADPQAFDPDANASQNLVYGAGPHDCPGRALATAELRILVEELLAVTSAIELDPSASPVRNEPPVGGYARVPLLVHL